jgi:hypothetical protein
MSVAGPLPFPTITGVWERRRGAGWMVGRNIYQHGYVTAVSLLKPPCGVFRSETATWIQKWFKKSVGTSRKLYI